MKRHYVALWLLFLLSFVIFATVSAVDEPHIGSYRLKTAEIVPSLTAPRPQEGDTATLSAVSVAADSVAVDSVDAGVLHFPVACDTVPKTILLFGDSMLEGIGPRLAAYAKKNGHTLYTVIWYSSTSEVWGRSTRLKHYIDSLKPSYIFVSLGANELFVPDIADKRRQYVDSIISDIDTIPYVWIGPPNWKPDTGINNLVAEETPAGCFFLSDGMTFERSRDGAHPTRKSAAAWMDSVARWMPEHSRHPILMDTPDEASARAKRIFVHQPSEK